MNALIDKQTRILVQGITGNQGKKVTLEMLDYGTNVVAGVTPGKGGQDICGLPVYNSIAEALLEHPEINTSLVSVPREGTKDAALEAIACDKIRLINILTEGLPQRDSAQILQAARDRGVRVVGPASIGIINPIDRVKVGAIGGNDPGVFYPGEIAVFSKSGGMCLSIATEIFNVLGHGTSLVVGIGGDRVTGTNFCDLLELVRNDQRTSLVIINGEVGGTYEEEAARYIRETHYPKPVVARITGIGAQNIFPRGSRMGHAGAIIGDGKLGTYESKVEAFERAGVKVAKTSEELVTFVETAMPRRGQDFEAALSKDFELVSISKSKLENLKSQVCAVQIRTHLTQIVDGMPYFRGQPLPQLMRRSFVSQMIYEAITKEDAGEEQIAQTAKDLVLSATAIPAGEAARNAAVASFRGGSPMNAAVAAGLLTIATTGPGLLPAGLLSRYSPAQANALVLIPQVIELVAAILGNVGDCPDFCASENGTVPQRRFQSPRQRKWDCPPWRRLCFPLEPRRRHRIDDLCALSGRKPSTPEATLMRAIFISCVDHTPATPSSLAAVTSYSGGNSLKTALAAGITAMGDAHAGAGEGTARILTGFVTKMHQAIAASGVFEADGARAVNLKELAPYIVNKITGAYGGEKGKIPGYGHRYYGLYGKTPVQRRC